MAQDFQTFGSVIGEAFAELGVDSGNAVAGLSQAEMEQWGNRFCKIFLQKCKLPTQDDVHPFRTVADTQISAAASAGATGLTMASSAGYPSSGALLLDGIPMTFTRSGTALTVPALERDFSSGDAVRLLYALPSNFGRPRALYLSGSRLEPLRWGTFERLPSDHYSTWGDYLALPEALSAGQDATLHYYARPTNTLSSSSTMEIYQMLDGYVIARLVARGYRILQDMNMAQMYELQARELLATARTFAGESDLSPARGFTPAF